MSIRIIRVHYLLIELRRAKYSYRLLLSLSTPQGPITQLHVSTIAPCASPLGFLDRGFHFPLLLLQLPSPVSCSSCRTFSLPSPSPYHHSTTSRRRWYPHPRPIVFSIPSLRHFHPRHSFSHYLIRDRLRGSFATPFPRTVTTTTPSHDNRRCIRSCPSPPCPSESTA
jgi:hypothetical protein